MGAFMHLHDWIRVTPTRDDFAQQLMRMAEQRGYGGWTYQASEFRLRGDEADAWVDLGDLYLEYSQAEAADRLDLLEKYLRELRTTSLSSTYRVQRDVLQPKMGDNLYVATFSMIRHMDTQEVYSWCTWVEDTDSLLPRTDLISFAKRPAKPEEGELVGLWVPWNEVERICGHHLRKTDEDPVRYRVESFPSESEWQQLKQRAIPVD
jgi:hypothetical protein